MVSTTYVAIVSSSARVFAPERALAFVALGPEAPVPLLVLGPMLLGCLGRLLSLGRLGLLLFFGLLLLLGRPCLSLL